MAIRQIAKIGEPVLRKKAKVVTKFDDKLVELLEDMADTMYEKLRSSSTQLNLVS